MNLRKTLGAIVLASALGLASCSERAPPSDYVEGKVIKEYGSQVNIVDSKNYINGGILGSDGVVETVKIGKPTYGIQVETPNGVYTIDFNDFGGSEGPKNMDNLSAAIDIGTIVKFPTKNVPQRVHGPSTGFYSDRVGVLDPDNIEIIYEN